MKVLFLVLLSSMWKMTLCQLDLEREQNTYEVKERRHAMDNTEYTEKSRFVWLGKHYAVAGKDDVELVDSKHPVSRELKARLTKLSKHEPIKYWLYTRQSGDGELVDLEWLPSLMTANFSVHKPLNVLIYDYLERDYRSEMPQLLKTELLRNKDSMVLVVDWKTKGVRKLSYVEQAVYSFLVGSTLGERLDSVLKRTGYSFTNVHLIGYGLGAHIAGVAGRAARGYFERITALDPASPWFKNNPKYMLNKKDAQYVEVIHTDPGLYGVSAPLGHADFYVSDYGYSDVCPEDNLRVQPCLHRVSYDFYAKTLSSYIDAGVKCEQLRGGRNGMDCNGETLFENAQVGNDDPQKRVTGIYLLRYPIVEVDSPEEDSGEK